MVVEGEVEEIRTKPLQVSTSKAKLGEVGGEKGKEVVEE